MFLAIDIGNSSINTAIFDGDNIIKYARFDSEKSADIDFYFQKFKQTFLNIKITDCAIISVINGLDYTVKNICDEIFNIKSTVLSVKDAKEIKINTKKPETIGMDRIANLYGALKFPLPAIIVDIGTAITFDILSKDKEFPGGVIMPGINMSLIGLHERTSKLPLIEPKESLKAIGNTTETCILSGVIRGTASAIDGLLIQCTEELGECKTVVLTGGQAELISKYMTHPVNFVNQDWTILGIKKMYDLSR
jgi:type III pantothenate kinase